MHKRRALQRYGFVIARVGGLLARTPFSADARMQLTELSWQLGHRRHGGRLDEADLEQLVPVETPATLFEIDKQKWNTSTEELAVLAKVSAYVRPRELFEFGTYDGRGMLAMLAAAPAEARAWSVDLPAELNPSAPSLVGRRLAREPWASRFAGRFTQLLVDGRSHDFSEFAGRMDLVFVDAGHDYVSTSIDTKNALRIVSPRGWILWHDYASVWPDVTRVVDELAADPPPGRRFAKVAGTSLAVCCPVHSPSAREA